MTLWTVAYQAPLSVGFSREEYWNALSFPPPGDLLDPEIEPMSLASPVLQADSLPGKSPGLLWLPKFFNFLFWNDHRLIRTVKKKKVYIYRSQGCFTQVIWLHSLGS